MILVSTEKSYTVKTKKIFFFLFFFFSQFQKTLNINNVLGPSILLHHLSLNQKQRLLLTTPNKKRYVKTKE